MLTVLDSRARDDGGVDVDVRVPPDSPYFRGHFPRAPVLPAVALLELVARLGAAHLPDVGAPRALHGLRLRATVEPDARLAVRLTPAAGALAFAVTVAGRPAAQGRLGLAPEPAPDGVEALAAAARADLAGADGEPERPELPHEGAALLVDEVVARSAQAVTCRARIPAASPFRSGETVPALLAVELAAQASAAHDQDGPGGGGAAAAAGRGFLVGVRTAWLRDERLAADAPWTVHARRVSLAPPLRNYSTVVVDAGGVPVAYAEVGTWVPPGPAAPGGGERVR